MRDTENILALAGLKPDYMGFIFWSVSGRFVNSKTPSLPPHIKKTGVFVNATLNYIQSCIHLHELNAIQLHGKETPTYCQNVKQFDVEVIKAFSIADDFDFSSLSPYEQFVDYFLFDTKGKLPGGNGIKFNWSVLNGYASQKPFFLSGGIGPESMDQIRSIGKTDLPLYAIDVNSKFEAEMAYKNIDLLTQFKDQLDEL